MKKTIRNFGIFVVLLSTVTLMSSCKKDVSNLPGTWRATTATINGDNEDDLKDVWTFVSGGTCSIECDFDEYFDNDYLVPEYDVISFDGTYATDGNKRITITSEKFHDFGGFYEQIVYDLDILSLNKKNMTVSGTIKYYRYDGNIVNTRTSDITVSLRKK